MIKKEMLNINDIACLLIIIINLLAMAYGTVFPFFSGWIPYINIAYLFLMFSWNNKFMEKKICIYSIWVLMVIFLISIINGTSVGAISSFLSIFLTVDYFRKKRLSKLFCSSLMVTFSVLLIWGLYSSGSVWALFEAGKAKVNPNMVGSAIYIAFFMVMALLEDFYGLKKIFYISILLICIYAEKLCGCRTSMVLLIFFGGGYFLFPKKIIGKKIIEFFSLIVMVGGCIFPILYIILSKNMSLNNWIYQVTGKGLNTGRQWIWLRLFQAIGSNEISLWLGLGSGMEYEIGQGWSMHNVYMQMLLNFGIVGIVLFVIFIFYFLHKYLDKRLNQKQQLLLVAYLGILVMSYTEVSLMGPFTLIIYNMVLGLAINQEIGSKKISFIRWGGWT